MKMLLLSVSQLFWLFSSLQEIAAVHPAKRRSYLQQENGVPFSISGKGKWNTGGGRTALDIHIDMGASPAFPGTGTTGQTGSTPGGTTAPPATSNPTSPSSSSTLMPSSTPSATSGSFSDEETRALRAHNKFRAVHNSPPMTLNREMSDAAAAYARQIAATGTMLHSQKSQRPGQGENLSMGCSSNKAQSIEEAIENWYNEVCSPGYQFGVDGSQGGTGHFTQVVWAESLELGIGRAETTMRGMKCAYIVGRYKPPGNFQTGNNDYVRNVIKGSFDKNAYCSTINNNRFRDDPKNGKNDIVGTHGFAVHSANSFLGSKRAKLHKKHH